MRWRCLLRLSIGCLVEFHLALSATIVYVGKRKTNNLVYGGFGLLFYISHWKLTQHPSKECFSKASYMIDLTPAVTMHV